MVNAIQLAMDFHAALPEDEVPEKTEGREGFYHVLSIDGTVDEAHSQYIVRDHDREKFEERKQVMKDIVKKMNADLGEERVVMNMFDQYYNMREVIEKDMTVVDLAKKPWKILTSHRSSILFEEAPTDQRFHLWACRRRTFCRWRKHACALRIRFRTGYGKSCGRFA